jgi:hypothetical protein
VNKNDPSQKIDLNFAFSTRFQASEAKFSWNKNGLKKMRRGRRGTSLLGPPF